MFLIRGLSSLLFLHVILGLVFVLYSLSRRVNELVQTARHANNLFAKMKVPNPDALNIEIEIEIPLKFSCISFHQKEAQSEFPCFSVATHLEIKLPRQSIHIHTCTHPQIRSYNRHIVADIAPINFPIYTSIYRENTRLLIFCVILFATHEKKDKQNI